MSTDSGKELGDWVFAATFEVWGLVWRRWHWDDVQKTSRWHASSRQQLHRTKLERLRKHSAATAGEFPSCSWEVLNTCDTETKPAKLARLKRTLNEYEW